MSVYIKIQENEALLTAADQKIVAAMRANPAAFLDLTISALAVKIGVSASALTRLAKKLGYADLRQLKIELAKDELPAARLDDSLSADDDMQSLMEKLSRNEHQTLQRVKALVQPKVLEELLGQIERAKRIFLFGIGASGLVCLDLMYKLSRIGYDVVYFIDGHTQLSNSVNLTEDDLALGISYSGETKEVYEALRRAQSCGAAAWAITRLGKNRLSRSVKNILPLPEVEEKLRIAAIASRNVTLFLTDLIYVGLYLKKTEQNLLKLVQSRELVKPLRE